MLILPRSLQSIQNLLTKGTLTQACIRSVYAASDEAGMV